MAQMEAVIEELEELFQRSVELHIDPTVTIRNVCHALIELFLQWHEEGKSLNVPMKRYNKLKKNVKKIISSLSTRSYITGSITTPSVPGRKSKKF